MSADARPVENPAPPPFAVLLNLITGKWASQAVHVVAKLGIADLLAQGPVPCDELARANQVDEDALYRLLRAAASLGLFREVAHREFGLAPLGELLRSDIPGSMRGMATMMGEEWSWRPWGDLWRSVKSAQPAFNTIYGMNLFEYFHQHPDAGAVFDQAMTGFSERGIPDVVRSYDFAGCDPVVDVGGGQGAMLCGVLKANPGLRGILFEQPNVIERGRARIQAEGLAERCQAEPGDFLQAVPTGCRAYLLRHVIHDWDDATAIKILRNCRDAMAPDGRVLLVEIVIPRGDGPCFGKLLDLEMLVIATGRERTEAEYAALFTAAGLKLSRVVPAGADHCIIEARRA